VVARKLKAHGRQAAEACADGAAGGILPAMDDSRRGTGDAAGAPEAGVPRGVLCAACGSLFPSGGALPGASVLCTFCGESVEIAQLVVERRAVRRTGDATLPVLPIPRDRVRRALTALAVVLALVVASAVVYALRDPLGDWVADAWSRLRPAPARPESTTPPSRR
jgi:hypothetical protein